MTNNLLTPKNLVLVALITLGCCFLWFLPLSKADISSDDVLFANKLRKLMKDEVTREHMGQYATSSVQKFSIQNIGNTYYSFLTSHLK